MVEIRMIGVTQMRDSTYLICGSTESFGATDRDVYLVHIDQNGDTLWTNVYSHDGIDNAYSIYRCEESGLVISGSTDGEGAGGTDMMLMKIYDDGDLLWRKTYGGTGDDVAYDVKETKNFGYALVGSSTSHEEYGIDMFIVTTNDFGDSLQAEFYGNTDNDEARATWITEDNKIVFTGTATVSSVGTLSLGEVIACPAYYPRGIWFGQCWTKNSIVVDNSNGPNVFNEDGAMLIDNNPN